MPFPKFHRPSRPNLPSSTDSFGRETVRLTRAAQDADVLYLLPDGTCFWSPDGEGRFWYDNVDDAQGDHLGPPMRVVKVSTVED